MDQEAVKTELEKLIQQSASFDEAQKKELIQKIPTLAPEKLEMALQTFQWEQQQLASLEEKRAKAMEIIRNFVETSKERIEKVKNETIREIENKAIADDKQKAENLLNF